MDKNAEIFMNINNVELGPYHLNQLVENGLVPDALVWWQGSANWMKASEVPELQPLLQQVAAAQQAVPAQQPGQQAQPGQPAQPVAGQQATMRCPYCGEEILAVARKCRYCGEWLQPIESDGFSGTEVSEPSTGLPTTMGPGGFPPISQPGGMPPISQPGGFPPISQPGGMPPISQPGGFTPPVQPAGAVYPGAGPMVDQYGNPIDAGYPAAGPMVDQYGNPVDYVPYDNQQSAPPPKKSNNGIIIAIIVIAVLAIVVAVLAYVYNSSQRHNYDDTDYGYGETTYEQLESVEAEKPEETYYGYDDSIVEYIGEEAEKPAAVDVDEDYSDYY